MSNKKQTKSQSKDDEVSLADNLSNVSTPTLSQSCSVSSSQFSNASSKRAVDMKIFPTPYPKKTKWAIVRATPATTIVEEPIKEVADPDFDGQQLVWQKFVCEEQLHDGSVKTTVMAAHARSQTNKVGNVTDGISNCFNIYDDSETHKGTLLNF